MNRDSSHSGADVVSIPPLLVQLYRTCQQASALQQTYQLSQLVPPSSTLLLFPPRAPGGRKVRGASRQALDCTDSIALAMAVSVPAVAYQQSLLAGMQ
jgi:hypothetical protein